MLGRPSARDTNGTAYKVSGDITRLPELAVVDMRMPGRSGLELVQALMEIDGSTKVVVLTGYGSIATAVEAMRLGASNYIAKPADATDILADLSAAFSAHAAEGS